MTSADWSKSNLANDVNYHIGTGGCYYMYYYFIIIT